LVTRFEAVVFGAVFFAAVLVPLRAPLAVDEAPAARPRVVAVLFG
jgi:hypothetical protein